MGDKGNRIQMEHTDSLNTRQGGNHSVPPLCQGEMWTGLLLLWPPKRVSMFLLFTWPVPQKLLTEWVPKISRSSLIDKLQMNKRPCLKKAKTKKNKKKHNWCSLASPRMCTHMHTPLWISKTMTLRVCPGKNLKPKTQWARNLGTAFSFKDRVWLGVHTVACSLRICVKAESKLKPVDNNNSWSICCLEFHVFVNCMWGSLPQLT